MFTWIGWDEGHRWWTRWTLAAIVPSYWSRSSSTGAWLIFWRTWHVHEIGSCGHRSCRRRQWHNLVVGRTVRRVTRVPPRHFPQVQVPRVNVLAVLKKFRTSFTIISTLWFLEFLFSNYNLILKSCNSYIYLSYKYVVYS